LPPKRGDAYSYGSLRVSRGVRSGVLAQLVERLNGIEEVRGSNPLGSKVKPKVGERESYRLYSHPAGCRLGSLFVC
jgi:hypothetical protein